MSIVRPIGQASGREELLNRITAIVRDASQTGGVLAVSGIGFRVLAEYPECGWSAEEIAAEVAKQATAMGVAVEL